MATLLGINIIPANAVSGPNRVGINIGDHFNEIDAAASIVGPGGWIVVMAQPGDCITLVPKMFRAHPDINFIIRGHYPDTELTPGLAKTWANTLANMDTAGKKIYFYPINEPRNEGISVENVKEYTSALVSELNSLGVKGSKVILLSPMIDKSYGGGSDTVSYYNQLGGAAFFGQFDGITINLYDFEDCGSPFCHKENIFLSAEYPEQLVAQMGVPGKPIYGAESGVVPAGTGRVVYNDQQLKNFFDVAHRTWSSQVKMAAVFSYDPHSANWSIYGSQTAGLFESLSKQYAPNPTQNSTYNDENYKTSILPGKLASNKYKLGEECIKQGDEIPNQCSDQDKCCVTYLEDDGTTYCRITLKTDACTGPLEAEQVPYRGEVVGPWRLIGKGIPLETYENPGTLEGTTRIRTQFSITPGGHYFHDKFIAFTNKEIGILNVTSKNYIDKLMYNFPPKVPSITRFAVPANTIYQEQRYDVPKQQLAPKENESWSDALKRRFAGLDKEIGTKTTTISTTFLGCIQEKDKDIGLLFPLQGKIELVTPPDISAMEIASIEQTKALAVPPCREGFCHPVHRFNEPNKYKDLSNVFLTPNDELELAHEIHKKENMAINTPQQTDNNDKNYNENLVNKTSNNTIESLLSPKKIKAKEEESDSLDNKNSENDVCGLPLRLEIWTDEQPTTDPNHKFSVTYSVKGTDSKCVASDMQMYVTTPLGSAGPIFATGVTASGKRFGLTTTSGKPLLEPGWGNAPSLPEIKYGESAEVIVDVKDMSRSPQPPCTVDTCPKSFVLTCKVEVIKNKDGLYEPDSACKVPPPPPPNCYDCTSWAPAGYCTKINAKTLKTEPRCPKGKCETSKTSVPQSCIWKAIRILKEKVTEPSESDKTDEKNTSQNTSQNNSRKNIPEDKENISEPKDYTPPTGSENEISYNPNVLGDEDAKDPDFDQTQRGQYNAPPTNIEPEPGLNIIELQDNRARIRAREELYGLGDADELKQTNENNPGFWETLYSCIGQNKEYDFFVSPTGPFIADLNKYRTVDMSVNDAISKIPRINEDKFQPEPSKAKIFLRLDPNKLIDFTLVGDPTKAMYIEYKDHVTQVRKYCERLYALNPPKSRGFDIKDPAIKELCDPVYK